MIVEIGRKTEDLKTDQKRTKWRLDGYAWVISKIEECSDLGEMLETMSMKFEMKRTWEKGITSDKKHYVQTNAISWRKQHGDHGEEY